jgi:hypothetical protein
MIAACPHRPCGRKAGTMASAVADFLKPEPRTLET